jgi:hypothetical protein
MEIQAMNISSMLTGIMATLALIVACNSATVKPEKTNHKMMEQSHPAAFGIPENAIFYLAEIAPDAHDSEGNARWAITSDQKLWYSRNNRPISEDAYAAASPTYFVSPMEEISLTAFPERNFQVFLSSLPGRPLCQGEGVDDGSRIYLYYKIESTAESAEKTDACFSKAGDPGMKAVQQEFFKVIESSIRN